MFATISALLTLAPMQSVATTPAHRLGEGWWKQRHEKCVELTKKGGYDLIFIGDSITQGWEGGGKPVWEKYYANRKAANFGFSGDRTEHVLWRMANGEIIGLQPKVAVIMIGTNNIGHKSSGPTDTAEGVRQIVGKLRTAMPNTKILLLGIFPRGATAQDQMRMDVAKATAEFQTLADKEHVFFEDYGRVFMSSQGVMWKNVMPDLLHPNTQGYEYWARVMEPTLKRLLGE
jgi:beta-glucosidase